MERREELPLEEAVAQGVIPCGKCGKPGAKVREVGGRKHFLCERCGGNSKYWAYFVLGVAGIVLLLLAGLLGGGESGPDLQTVLSELEADLREGRAEAALARARAVLEEHPEAGTVHCLAGQALLQLRRPHEAADHFRKALEEGGEESELCVFGLGRALALSDRAKESLVHLERPFQDPQLELYRQRMLAEVYLEVERYEDAIRLLDSLEPDLAWTRARFRALSYLGRAKEALDLLAGLADDDPQARATAAILAAAQSRESGDFDAAEKTLTSAREREPTGSLNWLRLGRSLLALYVEAGKTDLVLEGADRLVSEGASSYVTQGLWYRALGLLLAGRRSEAEAAAKTYLDRVPKTTGSYRLERLMMRHLAGGASDEEVAGEAAATSRVRANDLYFYLAAATENRDWAEKALASTPRHNFPYHAIRRLLDK